MNCKKCKLPPNPSVWVRVCARLCVRAAVCVRACLSARTRVSETQPGRLSAPLPPRHRPALCFRRPTLHAYCRRAAVWPAPVRLHIARLVYPGVKLAIDQAGYWCDANMDPTLNFPSCAWFRVSSAHRHFFQLLFQGCRRVLLGRRPASSPVVLVLLTDCTLL